MNKIYIVLLLSLLTGCQYGTHSKKVTDMYYLTYNDIKSEMSLSYYIGDNSFVGVVSYAVFAIGYNSDFIIVKNHPFTRPNSIDRTVTNYFIVPLDYDISLGKVDENKIGPFSEKEFNEKRIELKIPSDLDFTIFVNENK